MIPSAGALPLTQVVPQTDADGIADALGAIVGAANVLTQPADMSAYLNDWTGQYNASALAVVRPGATSEVAEVVTLCAARNIAVVPQGGRTGLCGGGVPVDGRASVVISLTRMSSIRSMDIAARTVTVDAGVVLETLHNAALEHGLIFPLMFGAKGSCTIGGNLATNAGGSNVLRYGNTRDLCLGIEAVLPDGTVVHALNGLRKDNTGYDLKNLLIGAEGTLGIITAAVLKLCPEPSARVTAFLSVDDLASAVVILNRLQDQTGGAVEAFEYMPEPTMGVINAMFPAIRRPLEGDVETGVLVEVASSRDHDSAPDGDGNPRLESEVMDLLSALMDEGLVCDAMVAQSKQQRADLWTLREAVLEAITKNGPAYHLDISLPLAKIAPFVQDMDHAMDQLGFQPLTVGHLGDGNLHYALSAAKGQEWGALPLEIATDAVFAKLTELGGSFSAEHGIGQSKLTVMHRLKQPAQLAAMRSIKHAMDPQNIMNPGKLLPPD